MENSLKQRIYWRHCSYCVGSHFFTNDTERKIQQCPFISKIPPKPKELEEYQIDTKKIDDLIAQREESNFSDNQRDDIVDTSQQSQEHQPEAIKNNKETNPPC